MLKSLFNFKDFDNHYIITVCGIRFSIAHKCSFKYKPVTDYGLEKTKRNPSLIVSLTSFPQRIGTAHYSINTLLNQSLKPDKVILWLADKQFPNKEKDLPKEIMRLLEFGLEIKWCEDLKSYKKLLPALKEFPNEIIVTADDDIYYEEDWLQNLYETHLANPKCICVQRPRRLALEGGKIKPLSARKSEAIDLSKPSYLNQMLGGSGCLYPPNSLYKDVFDIEKIFRLLPTNDDIYFWAMAILNRTKIAVANGFRSSLYINEKCGFGLAQKNQNLENQLKQDPFEILSNEYPDIMNILENED